MGDAEPGRNENAFRIRTNPEEGTYVFRVIWLAQGDVWLRGNPSSFDSRHDESAGQTSDELGWPLNKGHCALSAMLTISQLSKSVAEPAAL